MDQSRFTTLIVLFFLLFILSCTTTSNKIDALDNEISILEIDARQFNSALSAAIRKKDATSIIRKYLNSSDGRRTYIDGSCILPAKTTRPPNKCHSDSSAELYVRPICLAVALCVKEFGEIVEFEMREGQPWRNAFRFGGNALSNIGSTMVCSDIANLQVSEVDIAVAFGSAAFKTSIDDLISGGYSILSCANSLASNCSNKYRAWESIPVNMQRRCNEVTKPLRANNLTIDELNKKYRHESEIVASKNESLSTLRKLITTKKLQRAQEKAKIAPRKAGDVVISF